MTKEKLKTAEQFAKDHWEEILTISGSFVGGAILLLVGYHRHRRAAEGKKEEAELQQIESEIPPKIKGLVTDDSALFLETVDYTVQVIPEVEVLAEGLSAGLKDGAKEVMEAIKDMAVLRKNRLKKKKKE